MEILNSIIGVPYVFHCLTVSGVLLGAILLFVFGFKPAEEPAFNKIKVDSKSNNKKKKAKDKKSVSGSPSSDAKSKSSVSTKVKTPKSDDKGKKTNALKDSKTVNISAKPVKKETPKNESKKKGKENIDSQFDFSDDEGGWEQAISRKDKKNKKLQNGLKEGKQSNKDSGKSTKEKKGKENAKNQSPQNDKKQKFNDLDDSGIWQEAKSSKKKRKIQKEA